MQVSGSQWTEVKGEMESAEWSPDAVVALIQWIPKLTKDTVPSVLREALLQTSSSSPPVGSDPRALVELAGELAFFYTFVHLLAHDISLNVFPGWWADTIDIYPKQLLATC